MISPRKKPFLITLVLLILATLACALPQAASPPSPSTPITSITSQATSIPSETSPGPHAITDPTSRPTPPPPVADHRIATHRIYGIAEFYDTLTLQNFIPRGVNYFALVPVQDHYEDRLFASGVYDHSRTMADFSTISAAGYNTVRIIVDGCTSGDTCNGVQDGQGLNPTYLDNIADLMNLAKDANLFVLLASQDLPELGGYEALANQDANATFAAGRNAEFLTPAGIQAAQQYWSDLLGGLASRCPL